MKHMKAVSVAKADTILDLILGFWEDVVDLFIDTFGDFFGKS